MVLGESSGTTINKVVSGKFKYTDRYKKIKSQRNDGEKC